MHRITGHSGIVASHVSSPKDLEECIRNCTATAQQCRDALAYCRQKGGEYAAPVVLNALQNCFLACDLSIALMKQGSKHHGRHCGLCAELCRDAGEACRKFSDANLRACAETCARSEASCRKMAHGHGPH